MSLLGAAWTALAPVPRASACGGTSCNTAYVLPGPGPVPVDQLIWSYGPPSISAPRGDGAVGHPTLYRVRGAQREQVPLRVEYSQAAGAYLLTPESALEPGAQLVLTAEGSHCDLDAGLEATFQVTAETKLPASLGTLELDSRRGSIQVATWAGSCSVLVEASYVDLKLVQSDGAAALQNVIDYQLMLDGRPYEFASSLRGGKAELERWQERVYLPCMPMMHLASTAAGKHTAFMRGLLPNGESIETPEVSFELSCDPNAAPADAGAWPHDAQSGVDSPLDGGGDAADAQARTLDAGQQSGEAHASVLDAGAATAPVSQASTDELTTDAEASTCSARPYTSAHTPWWASTMLAALGWVAIRRRARR